ncbi:MAG: TrmB family transcriptional regulator [Candidatus Bathyarchaeales archaeon]
MTKNECIQILMDLGLTLLQARTYLALSKLGKATIKTISKVSNVARQDVYRIMPELEKLGLAEKIVAAPTMYKATPIKEGIYFLLQRKTQEYSELQKKTIKLMENLKEINDEIILEEEHQFIFTSSEKLLWKRLREGAEKAQISIDICTNWEGFRYRLFKDFPNFKRTLERGVRIRVITEKHELDKSSQKIIQALKANPLFEIRYLPPPVPIKTAIHDKKEVNLCLTTPNKIGGLPSLWSNNPQFVKIITNYYEELWNKAQSEADSSVEKVRTKKQKLTQEILSTSN